MAAFARLCANGINIYRCTPHSRWATTRNLLLEPIVPAWLGDWTERHHHSKRIAAWHRHSPIRPEFAAAAGVDARARSDGHDFLYRMRRDERVRGLLQVDYGGDWHAAEKALTGVEVRDPTADLDVVSYCFRCPARTIFGRRHRSILDPPSDVGAASRNRAHQPTVWDASCGLARNVQSPARRTCARNCQRLSQSPLARRAIDSHGSNMR